MLSSSVVQYQPSIATSDPDVEEYLEATKDLTGDSDPDNTTVTWGYMYIMTIESIAKQVGPGNCTSQAIMPGVKQPPIRVMKWSGTQLEPVPTGPDKDGWTYGF